MKLGDWLDVLDMESRVWCCRVEVMICGGREGCGCAVCRGVKVGWREDDEGVRRRKDGGRERGVRGRVGGVEGEWRGGDGRRAHWV